MPKSSSNSASETAAQMDAQIAGLEQELEELEAPDSFAITWEALSRPGAGEELARRDMRKRILPRLINAGRIKKLQLEKKEFEAVIPELQGKLEKAHARIEEALEQQRKAQEKLNEARYQWSDADRRINSRRSHAKRLDRQIADLKAGREPPP